MTKNIITLTEKENQTIKNNLEFFRLHNKNLTKEQYFKIIEIADILQGKL